MYAFSDDFCLSLALKNLFRPDFVASKPTKFLVHGWNSNPGAITYATLIELKDAFLRVSTEHLITYFIYCSNCIHRGKTIILLNFL